MNKITKKQIEAAIRTDFGLCVSLIKDKDHFYFTDAAQDQFVVDKFQITMVYVQTNTVKVKPGTGNTGDNLEYQATYSGVDIPYPQFVSLMNSISL